MQSHSFTTPVVPNILIAVPGKKEKLPLSVTHPELAKEADGWDPSEVTKGSQFKKQWKCSKSHTWIATIGSRSLRNLGCPYCSGNKVLVGINNLGTTHPKLAEELNNKADADLPPGSHKRVLWRCTNSHEWESTVANRALSGSGCPYCSGKRVSAGVNDLATTHPLIAAEADGWDPKLVSFGSQKKMKWRCLRGHDWVASIGSRTLRNLGCPYCAGTKVWAGFNDLRTTHPSISFEADGWDPAQISQGSNVKKKWKCGLGHTWQATVSARTNKTSGCPYCAGKSVLKGFNDLKTKYPLIAIEAEGWDPSTSTSGSGARKLWKCSVGHTWKSSIHNRVLHQSGCPSCAATGFNPDKPGYLYFLKHSDWEMLQIGITNFPDNRLHSHRKLGWKLLELRGPMDGHLTQQWETAILRMLKSKGADLSNEKIAGKFDGYSEAWSKSTFEVSSIKELMRLTEEFEDKK